MYPVTICELSDLLHFVCNYSGGSSKADLVLFGSISVTSQNSPLLERTRVSSVRVLPGSAPPESSFVRVSLLLPRTTSKPPPIAFILPVAIHVAISPMPYIHDAYRSNGPI
jgi:hypothetical protein